MSPSKRHLHGAAIAYKKSVAAVNYCGIIINNSKPFNHCKAYFGHHIEQSLPFIFFSLLFLCIMSLSGEACHCYNQGNPCHEAALSPNVDLYLQNHDQIQNLCPSSHTMESKPPVPFLLGPDYLPATTTQDPFAFGSMTSWYMGLEACDSKPMEQVPTSSWQREQTSMCNAPRSTQHCFHNGKHDHKNQSNGTAKITSGTPVSKSSLKAS